MSDEFLTVSELGTFIRDVLKSGFPRALWVCGEIQELREKNNHLYFTLSEKESASNQVVAKIGATIWANSRLKIEQILKNTENAFALKEDIQVKLLVKIDYYAPFGQIRAIVESIDPIYTLGKIAQDRQRLIALLKQKGIFELNKRLTLPPLMLNIGLITSNESAAYHDFTDELKKSGYAFNVFLIDATMQGKNAQQSVVNAIASLSKLEIDAIVITRGGGSVTDLSCFDSEAIATAIAHSQYPVISGIGHEINTTITDMAAHTFAKTPTAVAQMLVKRVESCLVQLDDVKERLFDVSQEYLTQQQRQMKMLADTFKRTPVTMIKLSQERLKQYKDSLKKTIHLHLERSRDKIKQYQKLIDMADPKNTLKRGFSITRDVKGRLIRTIKQAKAAKVLTTVFVDGTIESDVKK